VKSARVRVRFRVHESEKTMKGGVSKSESEGNSFVREGNGFVREETVYEEFVERGKSHDVKYILKKKIGNNKE